MNILELNTEPAIIGRGSGNGTLRELKRAVNEYSARKENKFNWRNDFSTDAVRRRGRRFRTSHREAEA